MKWYPNLGVLTLASMAVANAADKVKVSNLTVTDTASYNFSTGTTLEFSRVELSSIETQ
ncbi:hypothetical protein [Pseudomonas syringae]|uniref:hypothetical protein n=1 Tax=Pseudomonas syringae TaxID=317 RepID=UPI001BCA79DA|nr:hypothetical protein [Pseudomonas syringae]QVK35021.1 hypothetical protein KIJ28_25760 [Pseudomonas syringae]